MTEPQRCTKWHIIVQSVVPPFMWMMTAIAIMSIAQNVIGATVTLNGRIEKTAKFK